jgi:hypothetical protein
MSLKRSTLEALAAPLNCGDFAAFVAAVERLPSSERNALAVLGAGHLFRSQLASRGYVRSVAPLISWLADFQQTNVDDA